MALSVATAEANTNLNEKVLIAEVDRLNAREEVGRDHATDIDGTSTPGPDTPTNAAQALAREYGKLKTSLGLQLKTGLVRNWDYFLVCIPLIVIKVSDLITR